MKKNDSYNNISWKGVLIPSFTELTNIASTYNYFGPQEALIYTGTSRIDSYLMARFNLSKTYLSTSVFWGNLAFKSFKQIKESSISEKYKLPLCILSALVSGGIILKGNNIFKSKDDISETLKSIGFLASFFDKDNTILHIKEGFTESNFEGAKRSIVNLKQLLSNKFILSILMQQGLDITQLYLMNKFILNFMPADTSSILNAAKENKGFNHILTSFIIKISQILISFTHKKMSEYTVSNVKKEVNISIAKLMLKGDKTQVILKLGDNLKDFPHDIESTYNNATNNLSDTLTQTLAPFISLRNKNTGQSFYSEMFNKFPILILFNSLIDNINIGEVIMYIKNLAPSSKPQEEVGVGYTIQKWGKGTLKLTETSETYTYNNIQEIVKLGAEQFMLDKLISFINYNSSSRSDSNIDVIGAIVEHLKTFTNDMIFINQLKLSSLSEEETIKLRFNLTLLNTILKNNEYTSYQSNNLERAIATLKTLEENEIQGPTRIIGKDPILKVKNYSLVKNNEAGSHIKLLDLNELTFNSEKIYAIQGKIGTGKTTFLSDLAKCLAAAFSSSGTIEYPAIDGQALPIIFCGTMFFSPPATSLLEKITYRLPIEYRNNFENKISTTISMLFKDLGQKELSNQTLENFKDIKKEWTFSTGQQKLITLISAILYKKFLDKDVLFIIDETLSNLDEETADKICNLIKKIFKGSIILCVDHDAKTKTNFYDHYITLNRSEEDPTADIPTLLESDNPYTLETLGEFYECKGDM